MTWRVVERRLGRAGNLRSRRARQRVWTAKYGEDWAVGYLIDGEFVSTEAAFERVYVPSYAAFFDARPDVFEALVALAGALHNPHAEATGGVDLQVPAIEAVLAARGRRLAGRERVDIGSFGERSHAISARLTPSAIPCAAAPGRSLERWWQQQKVLAVWTDAAE